MTGRNILELAANQEIDGQHAFEATFAPTTVHELMLEFEPRHSGPPVVRFSGPNGTTEEIHPLPQPGRDGRYQAQLKSHAHSWSKINVTTARNVKAKLVRVKLISASPGAPPPTT